MLENISMLNSLAMNEQDQQNIFTKLKNHIQSGDKVGIAVSWWPDSIFVSSLIYSFFITNWRDTNNIHIIHINHNTRPENKTEQEYLERFFSWQSLSIFTRSIKPWNIEKKATEGILRERRFSKFSEFSKTKNLKFLVLWHNLTDRIETSFLNMIRWSHLKGFLGINFCESHHLLSTTKVLRPLLSLDKDKITNLCKQNNLNFFIDPTNKDTNTSKRNTLRNKIIPEMLMLADNPSSFFNSFDNLYWELEKQQQKNDKKNIDAVVLQKIKSAPTRGSKRSYEIIINSSWSINIIIKLLEDLKIYKNISKNLLTELLKFFSNNKSWHKYFNWVYFFISHQKFYAIKAPENFWKQWHFQTRNYKYKGKTRNKRCINQKIPIFWRNFIPIVHKEKTILSVDLSVIK